MVLFCRFVKIPRVGWIASPGPISGVGFYIYTYVKGNQMKYSILLAALLAASMTVACGKKEEAAAPVEAPAAEAPAPMEAAPMEAAPAPMEAAPAEAAPAAPAEAAPAAK